MLSNTNRGKKWDRVRVFAVAVFIVFFYHLVRYLFPEIWDNVYCVYYVFLVPVLIAFTLWFRRGNEPLEIRLYLLFWAWVFLSRLLNGDFYLTNDADFVLNTGLAYVFLIVCLNLKGESRQRFLDWISILTSGFFTLLSLPALYGWLLRKELYNPLTGGMFCSFEGAEMYRLTLFFKSCNEVSFWFFLSLFLLAYLFQRRKNWWWRIPILLAVIPNYLVLTVTYSRASWLACSVCSALLILMVFMKKYPHLLRKISVRLLASLVCVMAVAPLTYVSFNETAVGMQYGAAALASAVQIENVQEKFEATPSPSRAEAASYHVAFLAATGGVEEPFDRGQVLAVLSSLENGGEQKRDVGQTPIPLSVVKDTRGLSDSGRFDIYKCIIPTMQQDPLRLLRGCLCKDVMNTYNKLFVRPQPHFHNTFLQLLCLTGLPGLLLILAFCALVARRSLRLFFSDASLDVKSLTLILVGTFIYNMLETALFVAVDTRSLVAYIAVGAVLAYTSEADAG